MAQDRHQIIAGQVAKAKRRARWDLDIKTGAVFRYGPRSFECKHNKKDNTYFIEKLPSKPDRQDWIKFCNVWPEPPLAPGDVLMYGDDNFFCCYGAYDIVSMTTYANKHTKAKKGHSGYQYLIGS